VKYWLINNTSQCHDRTINRHSLRKITEISKLFPAMYFIKFAESLSWCWADRSGLLLIDIERQIATTICHEIHTIEIVICIYKRDFRVFYIIYKLLLLCNTLLYNTVYTILYNILYNILLCNIMYKLFYENTLCSL